MLTAAFRVCFLGGLLTLAVTQSGQSGLAARTFPKYSTVPLPNSSLVRLEKDFAEKNYAQTVQDGQLLLSSREFSARSDLSLRASRLVGAAQLALGKYRDTLRTLLPARKIASERSDLPSLVSINNNIAWIYVKMENLQDASEYADQAVAALRAEKKKNTRLLSLRALIFAKEGEFARSDALFSESINDDLDSGDIAHAAEAWEFQGRGYAVAHRTAEAEFALTESFRLRKIHHLPDLEVSMRDLAEELAERGDFKTSTVLLDEAVAAMGNPKSTIDIWGFLLDRGRLRMMKGDLRGALPDLRGALAIARRLDVIPTDDDRITFESGLAELYSLLIDCGNRLYLQNRDPALKAEIFEAAEENRAASLRALVPQPHGWRTHLPPEYSDVLAHLQSAERELLTNPGRTGEPKVRQLRVRIDQMESRYQAEDPSSQLSALDTAKIALDRDTAILSFHLGKTQSWLWLITQKTFAVFPLPAESSLAQDFGSFRAAIRSGADAQALGESLGRKLFDCLPAEVHRKSKWIIALDQELFDLPFAALRWKGRYLIEDHSILVTPGVRLLKARGSEPLFDGDLIALGDPIYNRADPRWSSPALFRWNVFAPAHHDLWHFPRLIGSGQEARSAVACWGNGRTFTGKDAIKLNLLRISQEHPTIIHLATHVIRAAGNDRAGMIVLGLNSQGDPEFLDMRDIVQKSVHAQLVVMSGCASGDAKARPASGLMGLTRAWLGAGVDDVLATRWPSLDDNGPFFSSFYAHLRNDPRQGATGALQQASVAMLHSNSFRANPEYWAGYFLIGKV